MTPFLTAKLAGQYVVVDAAGLFMSTLQVNIYSMSAFVGLLVIATAVNESSY